ncbi:ethylene-responsive transcription factor CRF1-like [Aegilops tauschii subsp. strangulata]|uniref:ethylene-responsive transcription factor CRF1-like n=1 Tax=Aegilops tauschii subsp. strangulata TaxID=200361 RepID=UPI003CC8BE14
MPPRRRETWGYHGVCAPPSGGFSAEIQFCAVRLGLGTFDTAHEAVRLYDAAGWRLRRPHREMNFPQPIVSNADHGWGPQCFEPNRATHRVSMPATRWL